MRIYILLVLLFFSLNQLSAQTVQLHQNKISEQSLITKAKSSLVLTLKALLEGVYTYGILNPEALITNPPITIELHEAATPYRLVETQTGTINNLGVGTFTFSTATNGTPYYIVVKSANSVQIWSANAVSFTSNALSYDFTTGVDKGYTDGSNPPLALHYGKYCIYSGDIDQDGYVTGADYAGVDNDNFNYDYHIENDINGDGFITGDDYTFIDNNNFGYIQRQIPLIDASTIEYEGKTYHMILIGTHYWLKENLNVGTMLTGDQGQTDNGSIEKYCFGDDPANCDLYGGLYTWDEAMKYTTTPGAQGICPTGWHIPTIAELNTLSIEVNGDGNALKEIGQGTGAGVGTNTSGFSALIGGYFYFGGYYDSGISTDFWSSTENDLYTTNYIYLFSWSGDITLTINDKAYGYSVRCIKD